jgi:hypothetical protein
MFFLVVRLASVFNPIAYFSLDLVSRSYSHTGFSPQRKGLRRDGEGAEQLHNKLASFALVLSTFLLPHVFFIE